MNKISNQLIEKSKEAFIMAIELYNKPTIKYRVEGFAIFICNAWELMLKAHMIEKNGQSSIYFQDNPERTLPLSDCIKKVFTNDKDPLRINLEKIIELRNTSTHFITEEYEMVYVPLFQACVLNFNDKILDFHNIDMTTIIPQNFLTLSVSMHSLNESEIMAKYPEIVSKKLFAFKSAIETLESTENQKFAIRVNVSHFLTKNPKNADATFHIAKNGEEAVAIIKEIKDPELVYRFTTNTSIETISKMLRRNKLQPKYKGSDTKFTKFHFSNLVKYFGIKEQKNFCWKYKVGNTTFYRYSLQALEFIVNEIKKDPDNILDKIK